MMEDKCRYVVKDTSIGKKISWIECNLPRTGRSLELCEHHLKVILEQRQSKS